MRGQPSQKEMNKIVFGEPSLVVAEFYDHDTVDSAASHAARKKIMKSVIYIHQTCEEEKAEGRRPMQEMDKRRHPQAWQAYEMRKEHESRNVSDIQPERNIDGVLARTYQGT